MWWVSIAYFMKSFKESFALFLYECGRSVISATILKKIKVQSFNFHSNIYVFINLQIKRVNRLIKLFFSFHFYRRTRSLNAPSPFQQFGPCGRIMKNSAMVMWVFYFNSLVNLIPNPIFSTSGKYRIPPVRDWHGTNLR